jgi:hypothetical protein
MKSLLVEGCCLCNSTKEVAQSPHIRRQRAVSVLAIETVNSIGNRASFGSTGPSYDQQ